MTDSFLEPQNILPGLPAKDFWNKLLRSTKAVAKTGPQKLLQAHNLANKGSVFKLGLGHLTLSCKRSRRTNCSDRKAPFVIFWKVQDETDVSLMRVKQVLVKTAAKLPLIHPNHFKANFKPL